MKRWAVKYWSLFDMPTDYGKFIQRLKETEGEAEAIPARDKPEPEPRPETPPARPASRKPARRKHVKTELRKHVKTPSRKAGKAEAVKWADTSGLVTVGAKAPPEVVTHWAVEAKRQKRPMSQVIVQALIDAFGLPEGSLKDEE